MTTLGRAAAVAIWVAACAGAPDSPATPARAEPAADRYAVVETWWGAWEPVAETPDPAIVVIASAAGWRAAQREHRLPPGAAGAGPIDFDRSALVCVFPGPQGGTLFRPAFEGVVRTGESVVVRTTLVDNPDGADTDNETSLVVAGAVARAAFDGITAVTFEHGGAPPVTVAVEVYR